jgi:hypothetical protein
MVKFIEVIWALFQPASQKFSLVIVIICKELQKGDYIKRHHDFPLNSK